MRWVSRGGLLGLIVAVFVCAGGSQAAVFTALDKAQAARAEGFGGASVALGGDPSLIWVNPASAADLTETSITLGGERGRLRDFTGQGLVAKQFPMGTLALGFVYFDAGSSVLYTGDGTARNVHLQQDFLGAVTYARAFGDVVSGINLKFLHSVLFEELNASALGMDAGLQIQLSEILRIGCSLHNFGLKMKYLEDSIALPTTVRGGVALGKSFQGVGSDERNTAFLMGDVEHPFDHPGVILRTGLEVRWRENLAVRGGVRMDTWRDVMGFSAGLGVMFRGMRLDYNAHFGGLGSMPHMASLTYLFGRKKLLAGGPLDPIPLKETAPAPAGKLAGLDMAALAFKKGYKYDFTFAPKQPDVAGQAKRWEAKITNRWGEIVRKFVGTGTPPKELEWDGTDARGRPVLDISKTKMEFAVTDMTDHRTAATTIVPIVGAVPRLRAAKGAPFLPEVTFHLPQDEYAYWKLEVADWDKVLTSWEGTGQPDPSLEWEGRDSHGEAISLDSPRYTWRFTDAEGRETVGKRDLPQVEVEVERIGDTTRVRLKGIRFEGQNTNLSREHWVVLTKAAAMIARYQETTLKLETYWVAERSGEGGRITASLRGENILRALVDYFRVGSSRIALLSHKLEAQDVATAPPESLPWQEISLTIDIKQ